MSVSKQPPLKLKKRERDMCKKNMKHILNTQKQNITKKLISNNIFDLIRIMTNQFNLRKQAINCYELDFERLPAERWAPASGPRPSLRASGRRGESCKVSLNLPPRSTRVTLPVATLVPKKMPNIHQSIQKYTKSRLQLKGVVFLLFRTVVFF